MKIIETSRLILRTWREDDAEAFAHINQDPKVIEYLRGFLTLNDAKDFIHGQMQNFAKQRMCFFAATLKSTGELIGLIGLQQPWFEAHFTPCVEIGWRLASQHWGLGYAPEGAQAVLKYGFEQLACHEIVSFTVPANTRSIRVMEKIGMQRDFQGDFAHPKLPPDHRLSHHLLYRIKNDRQEMESN